MRIAAGVEYDGYAFSGWQSQPARRTVEACMLEAISAVADHPVELICAGRTDAGVHARGQVIHFDTLAVRSPRSWLFGINANLPRDISLGWVRAMPAHFHARYSALTRSYRYLIINRVARSALTVGRALWVRTPLNVEAMNDAARLLLGAHDFTSFRSANCQSRSTTRRIDALTVRREGTRVSIEVTANAFLHHMVRNIAGSLLAVGSGEAPASWIEQLLQARDRRLAAATAAADGLYLARVAYPAAFGIPAPDDPL
jgi:tRNA pseudouridine38-40 synthase